MRVEINNERISELAKILRPYREVIKSLHKKDPQYLAIKSLIQVKGCIEGAILALINALVSYQLSTQGEEYWMNFANYFRGVVKEDYYKAFRDFLLAHSPRLITQKLSRVEKILKSELLQELRKDPLKYCHSINTLTRKLAGELRADPNSKTLLFAAKIYGYTCDLCGVEPDYSNISIPVDYRNTLLAIASCIVTIRGETTSRDKLHLYVREVYSRHSKLVQEAWAGLCEEIELPCPYLDTFTWLVTGIITRSECNVQKAQTTIRHALGLDLLESAVRELVKCWC
jgi:DNA-(apurinic or apyrimidinic site) lyase